MGATSSRPTPQITVNTPGADVPVIPPIAILALYVLSFLLAKYVDRFRWLPDGFLSSKVVRVAVFAMGFTAFLTTTFLPARDALHAADSGIAFTPTGAVATQGPYELTRNPLYAATIFMFMPLIALLFDSGWLLVAIAPMFVYLDRVVIPGEEAFLAREFGSYEAYMAGTPRWLDVSKLFS